MHYCQSFELISINEIPSSQKNFFFYRKSLIHHRVMIFHKFLYKVIFNFSNQKHLKEQYGLNILHMRAIGRHSTVQTKQPHPKLISQFSSGIQEGSAGNGDREDNSD